MEDPAAAVGPQPPPDVLIPRELPAALAHAFIARYSRSGDVVLDPFSGRGTTPLQACAEGRIGVGNDLNPFAHLLTASKVDPASPAEARTRLAALRLAWNADSAGWLSSAERVLLRPAHPASWVPTAGSGRGPSDHDESVPDEVALAFHQRTLAQLLFVRSSLRLAEPTDRFLAAALTGILHGKSASYLSELMPNTFSMAPRYVREFAARTHFQSPARDVFDCLALKLDRLYRQPRPRRAGSRCSATPATSRNGRAPRSVRRGDRTGRGSWSLRPLPAGRQVRLLQLAADVVAWLRRPKHRCHPGRRPSSRAIPCLPGRLGHAPRPDRRRGRRPRHRGRRDRSRPLDPGRHRAGGARLGSAAAPEGYTLAGVALDDVAAGRKMTKLWGVEAGRATKTDRILVLGASEAGRRRALAGAGLDIDWSWPPRALRAI